MQIYSYWRSQAAFRVRIALNLKGLQAQILPLDILKGDQHSDAYDAVNPQRTVPTLIEADGHRLVQSLAILEYLEECHPQPALLPAEPRARAYVRALALTLAGDAHPFVTPRVRRYLEEKLRLEATVINRWMIHWMSEGLRAVEIQLARGNHAAMYCCGTTPSIADLCLVPHIVGLQAAPSFDFGPYPIAMRVFANCMQLAAFRDAAPVNQPDTRPSATR